MKDQSIQARQMLSSPQLRRRLMQLPEPKLKATQARATWLSIARPSQVTPSGNWNNWLILAGRGFGKTRTGAEDAAWYGLKNNGVRIAIVAGTFGDARDTCAEGESGLLRALPPECVRNYNRSIGEIELFNDTRYKLFSADEPNRLRGPQHHRAWCDELAAWNYSETWDQLQFGLRLGIRPQTVITTTPRPTPLLLGIVKDPHTKVTRGSTFENAANLSATALAALRDRYEGTRLGRQELEAEILDDVPGALWTRAMLDNGRVKEHPNFQRVVVAVDPSGTAGDDDDGDSVGIICAAKGIDGHAYVLADRTCHLSPAGWGRRVVDTYREFAADRIVAERNFGGAMVAHVIATTDRRAAYREVTASRGKVVRAEPIAALYEQGRVHHIGSLPQLEDEMCAFTASGYVGEGSPDRADALVWALTDLMLGPAYGMLNVL